jgi:hypothetical protein
MNAPSPARRVRSTFMTFSILVSALGFFVVEGYALQDQLAIGHASAIFMLGTACLTAGACIGLFAILMAIGLAVSAVFSEEPAPRQSRDIRGVAVASVQTSPPPDIALTPVRTRSRRHQERHRPRTVTSETRGDPTTTDVR